LATVVEEHQVLFDQLYPLTDHLQNLLRQSRK